jgi:hypothetical protein
VQFVHRDYGDTQEREKVPGCLVAFGSNLEATRILPLALPEGSPPIRIKGFLLSAKPTFTLALINLGAGIKLVEGHMIDTLAASADVALDDATVCFLSNLSLAETPLPRLIE